MGISENRLKLVDAIKYHTDNFESTSDTNARLNSTSFSADNKDNETPTTIIKPNLLTEEINNLIGGVTESACAAAEGLFSAYDTVVAKIPKIDTALLKDLENDFNNVVKDIKGNIAEYADALRIGNIKFKGCSNQATKQRLESIYNRVKSINFSNLTISSLREEYLNKTINDLLDGNITLSGLVANDLNALTNDIKTKLLAATGISGLTVNQKLLLQKLFGNKVDVINSITDQSSDIAGSNETLSKLVLSAIFDQTSKTNPELTATMVSNLLLNPSTNRDVVIKALTGSIKNSNPRNIENNLTLLNSIVNTNTNGSVAISDKAAMRTNTANILKTISNSKTNSNSPTSDYNNIILGLSNLDSNWATDATGTTNYSTVGSNSRIVDLANSVTLSASADKTSLTSNVYTTALSSSEKIAILGKFNSSLGIVGATASKCA
jgi:hypothetical protein